MVQHARVACHAVAVSIPAVFHGTLAACAAEAPTLPTIALIGALRVGPFCTIGLLGDLADFICVHISTMVTSGAKAPSSNISLQTGIFA